MAECIGMIQTIIYDLPTANYNVLRCICDHLVQASTHEDITNMAEGNFAICFGQTILAPPDDQAAIMATGYANRFVNLLLNNVGTNYISRLVGFTHVFFSITLSLKGTKKMKPRVMCMKKVGKPPQRLTTSKGSRRRRKWKKTGCRLRATPPKERPPRQILMDSHYDRPGSFLYCFYLASRGSPSCSPFVCYLIRYSLYA